MIGDDSLLTEGRTVLPLPPRWQLDYLPCGKLFIYIWHLFLIDSSFPSVESHFYSSAYKNTTSKLFSKIYLYYNTTTTMGNFNVLNNVQQPPAVSKNKSHITVATLNYCGIAFSPFEFYFKDYEQQIGKISQIFRKLLPKYVDKFDEKTFKWDMGKIDKTFKKGRYSNMFDGDVGCFWKTLLTRQEFEKKWEEEFKRNTGSFKFQWKEGEKNTVRLYDFIMYHTLLEYAFPNSSFEEAIKNDAKVFKAKIAPFYQLSFLDQQAKLKKFLQGFNKLQPDVFFIQQYSTLLLDELKKSQQYVVTDPKEDSLVLLNKDSFSKFQDFTQISKEINEQQKKSFRWAESVAFAGADNYIFACVHLSSNEEKNKAQIENLKMDLMRLKEYLPKYDIIVGGDLNSFLKPDEKFNSKYYLYPTYDFEFTTLKRRTYSQAQFHKAETTVKESKDRILSTKNIEFGEVRYLGGGKADEKVFLPSHDHPYDHLLCYARISK